MILGIGLDVVDIARFTATIERVPALAGKLFTADERELAPASLAARFAAKEALAKALGAPPGLRWHDAEVVRGPGRAPQWRIRGTVADRAAELGVGHVHLSLTHDAGIAAAVVVVESAQPGPGGQ